MRSFRQVPTFGRDTIRKFGGSVSSLTKMTARGFEDIIQVGSFLASSVRKRAESLPSVGYPSSKGCSVNHITRSYWTLPSTWPPGTHMRSSGNTPSTPSGPFAHKQKSLVGSSATLPATPAQSTRRNVSRVRRPPAFAVVLERRRRETGKPAVGVLQRKAKQM